MSAGTGRQSFLCQGGLLLGPAPQEAPNEIIHMLASHGTDPARFLGVWTGPGRTRPLDHMELGALKSWTHHPPWRLASEANSEFPVCPGQ